MTLVEDYATDAIVAALSEENGVGPDTWEKFHKVLDLICSSLSTEVLQAVKATDDRFYLPDGWRD